MAGEIAGRPHWEVGFDERGTPNQGEVNALLSELPGRDLTDLLVLAHGWNSDRGQARRLYQLYFQQVPGLLAQGGSQARVGTLGVVWPSKRWADEPEPTGELAGGGAAGLGDAAAPAPRPPTPTWSRTSRTCSPATTSAGPWTSWPGCWPSGPRTRPPWPGSRT
jgi:hypothetical protein